VNALNEVYGNLLSISRGDVGTLKRVSDDFAKSAPARPVGSEREAKPEVGRGQEDSSR
jgi:hypothetical protein